MRQAARHSSDRAILWLYEWIIRLYLRYVLIRCAKFTNNRAQAEKIAAYTLVTTCLLAGELEHLGQLGLLVDTMVNVIGRDVVRHSPEPPDRLDAADGMLFTDGRLLTVAGVLNRLDRFTREVLVFHCVDGMDAGEVAGFLHRSAGEATAALEKGQRILANRLGRRGTGDGRDGSPYVRSLLAAFATAIDGDLESQIGRCALSYLAKHGGATPSRYSNRWPLN